MKRLEKIDLIESKAQAAESKERAATFRKDWQAAAHWRDIARRHRANLGKLYAECVMYPELGK